MKRLLALVALAVLACPSFAADVKAARPNVIVLLTDDNGYGDLGCHGHPFLKTPNFDRLHDQGIRLTDFHVAPMCTPTRASACSVRLSGRGSSASWPVREPRGR